MNIHSTYICRELWGMMEGWETWMRARKITKEFSIDAPGEPRGTRGPFSAEVMAVKSVTGYYTVLSRSKTSHFSGLDHPLMVNLDLWFVIVTFDQSSNHQFERWFGMTIDMTTWKLFKGNDHGRSWSLHTQGHYVCTLHHESVQVFWSV